MNQKIRQQLETTFRVTECLLTGQLFHVSNSEIGCVPVSVMTKTAAAKKGLILKRGAKRVGTWDCRVSSGAGKAIGDLYLATSFKAAQVARCGNSVSPACAKALVEANYVNTNQHLKEAA